ncbi:MAG: site-2 protease family protein [Deltaproteobacteria bacterium]|nr:site-2 protease family protein [Deltaproteobacteria bacterium]
MDDSLHQVTDPMVRPKVLLPAALFTLTVITTVIAGALHSGADIFSNPYDLLKGVPFSASLIFILGTHELGHYIASKRHGILTTLPVFIPGPPIPPLIGTFGAVIRIKSPITVKDALVDIGGAGPLSGFLVAIAITAIGLKYSAIMPQKAVEGSLGLGSSLVFNLLSYIVLGPPPDGYDVVLHPVAFAGWIGFFVTAMNLLPIGQLDGGHLVYALLGPRHRAVSIFMVAVLVILGIFTWHGWLLWAALITAIGMRHPPILDEDAQMDKRRKLISISSLAVFILTFMPTPFYVIGQ